MPVIKSAKKKLRKDKKITVENKRLKSILKFTLKQAEKKPTEANIKKAVKVVDKIAKKNVIHKNKASRIKSRLSKKIAGKIQVVKKTQKKSSSKK
ncbi:MAG: 30S ribosomal protein S20 [Candidatus Levybacteria bacterium CG_4_9_14_3_um_filter_35_16]|nr:MAG: 30S ribosomal protein S20 [Candidatus Levybacteria bacterium CG22_combo_CG10-13_8_21_14_all_35_11]PIY94442.1 MAG: 30S ribosomal protein S20 [Candidatus Levybacteria bacterium CG_4_10_14_0_8_um_filter_35_23]PJA00718.1 MAG: 30S ribosomal protein S20 [Candidatus Levybacteria bacterium CG_4_10_14_0_2_um_filter_35_8]PJA91543.1 MAG: 30S ribosomal protein S20 [Candidatus Levybacteria bacterium CG_4_9_14_3_um_filter_35_16]PJC54569.1 MAG: 30S ribosomal protein S20 [Candidatus Levybacteria bacter